jgi:hypothetical protein
MKAATSYKGSSMVSNRKGAFSSEEHDSRALPQLDCQLKPHRPVYLSNEGGTWPQWKEITKDP